MSDQSYPPGHTPPPPGGGFGAPPPPGDQAAPPAGWSAPSAPPPPQQPQQQWGGQQPQQQWGGQQPQQQWGGQQAQSDGLQPNVANLLSYLFGWLGGLIIYLTQRNPEVRFHGAQSILLSIAWVVTYIAWTVLTLFLGAAVDALGIVFSLGGFLLGIAFVGVWIYAMIQGFQQKHFKLPVIGGLAESWAAK